MATDTGVRAKRAELARRIDEVRTQLKANEQEAERLRRNVAGREAEIAGYHANLKLLAEHHKAAAVELKRLEREAAKVSGKRSASRPRAHPKAARAKK